MTSRNLEKQIPLCIDMDGTLLRTDSLDESYWAALSQKPVLLFKAPFWLSRGRAFLKAKLAPFGLQSVGTWPLRQSVIDLIEREKAAGRPIWLVTAADETLAQALAERLGYFDGVLASDGSLNLKGEQKARILVERFGERGFWYVGDSRSDKVVWARAERGFCVDSGVADKDPSLKGIDVLAEPGPRLLDWIRQMRVHQWSKNALLLVPMLAAHAVMDMALWGQVLAGMLFMSLVASGTYVLNDCLDLDGDRRVPTKRDRPLASGSLQLRTVVVVGATSFLIGLCGAFLTDPIFGLLLLGYAMTSIFYSTMLKRLLLLDIFMLSGFYVWRLVMGGELAGVPLSPWLLGFALFFFVSMALAKRYTELDIEHREGVESHLRRPYRATDLPVLLAFGVGASLVTVLVLALYINSDQSQALYAHPQFLWLLCPVLLYWLSRVWFKAHRGEMSADPVLFAIRDLASYLVLGLLMVIPLIAAIPF